MVSLASQGFHAIGRGATSEFRGVVSLTGQTVSTSCREGSCGTAATSVELHHCDSGKSPVSACRARCAPPLCDELYASTSQRVTLSLRCGRVASSSPPATATQRRYEALRAYLLDGLPAARWPTGSATPPPRCTPRSATSGPGQREFFLTGTPGPKTRTGQGRRPRADPRAARGRALHRRDRRRAGRRGHHAEPHRDRRGDRRRGAAAAVAPPGHRPRRPAARRLPRAEVVRLRRPARPGPRPAWPGCC